MRRARTALLAVAVTAAAGCGGDEETAPKREGLAWEGTPKVFEAKNLPDDRVVIARVRNTGAETLHLVAADLKVRDAAGRALDSTAAFTTSYAHGLYGMLDPPKRLPEGELVRLGKVAYIPAGASLPFYAAWRLKPGTEEPVSVDYGTGTLALPEATATAAGR